MNRLFLVLAGSAIAVAAAIFGFYLQQHTSRTSAPRSSAVTDKIVIQGTSGGNPAFRSPDDMPGVVRPSFNLPDQYGVRHDVSEWDGRVLVINFWATWCPPCRDEIPEFVEMQRKYADQGLQFIGIALQKADEVKDFVNELGINYPILVGEADAIRIAEKYGNRIGALPYTVVIGRDQAIQHVQTGALSREKAEAIILPLL